MGILFSFRHILYYSLVFLLTTNTLAKDFVPPFANEANQLFPSLPSTPSLSANPPSLAPVVDKVVEAVVSISVSGTKTTRQVPSDPFQFFFGPNLPNGTQKQPFRALGSGVIISYNKEYYIITNAHVVEDAEEITVTRHDGKVFKAKKIGEDKQTDFALLQIDAQRLKAIDFIADSDQVKVGDFALAIGNPFGLGQTVTLGIVSGLGRSGLNDSNYENFIQTDAAINSGNSGGALVNLKGELVGINTAILGPNGNIGIGFAIPTNMIRNLMEQILQFGEVRRGLLGIIGSELNAELAKTFGYDKQYGAFISQVNPGSAADKAGFKAGDIIVKLDNKSITSFHELRAKIATMGAGKKIQIEVIRDGKPMTLHVTLDHAQNQSMIADSLHPALAGAKLEDTSDEDNQGVLVTQVTEKSPAASLGLQEKDVIIGVNRARVKNLSELREIIKQNKGILALQIQRGRSIIYLVVQ